MTLSEIMQRVADDPACRVFPARGVPDVSPRGLTLPPELKTFYQTCGGVELFANATFGFRIVGLDEFVPSNPVLLGDYYRSNKNEIDADEILGMVSTRSRERFRPICRNRFGREE